MRSPLFLLALALPAAAIAQVAAAPAVTLQSNIQVVKTVKDAAGKPKRILEDPKGVFPGDPLVIWLNYRNGGTKPASGFVLNNPIPNAVNFTALGENSGWGVVSVDGGKSFGPLATLKVKGKDGALRAALPSDVTNVRWAFKTAIAPGASGTLSFYGVVK
jgi:hypothetical protein